ncbi:MAG: hypothetical protein JXD22_11440 [Sedimentisphaerales bacterium]|nr:hypothetical protein [Sedimentisphaerales bacterium]
MGKQGRCVGGGDPCLATGGFLWGCRSHMIIERLRLPHRLGAPRNDIAGRVGWGGEIESLRDGLLNRSFDGAQDDHSLGCARDDRGTRMPARRRRYGGGKKA